MTEQTTPTPIEDYPGDEPFNSGEVTIPSPIKKENTPKKRATRAKSTSKRKQSAKSVKEKANSKSKETKAKTTKTKENKAKATKPAKEETKEKVSKPPTPTLSQMDMRHQLVLYTMNRMNREVTYGELGDETGLSRAILRRVMNAQIGNHSLIFKDLVEVNQYETEDGESLPYYFLLTDAGKKMVS